MNPAPPPEGGNEPADLSQLAATDALLDRLGARRATGDDLLDPTVSALAEMLAGLDEYREPDLGLSQLVEVLAGRPLYLSATDEPVEVRGLDRLAQATSSDGAAGGSLGAEPRLIDLTDRGRAEAGRQLDQGDLDRVDGSGSSGEGGAGEGQVAAFVPQQVSGRRWERALSQLALPAAAVVLLVALGSGVSAAVTGDPMTALNGVSRVVAQFPGVSNAQGSLTKVRGEISAADSAVQRHDPSSANQHLAAARRGLTDVPDDSKTQLNLMITNVEDKLIASQPAASVIQPSAPVGVVAATPSAAAPSPSGYPSPTTTPPIPSEAPTTQPAPTSVSDPSESVGVTLPGVDPTSVVTTPGS